MLHRKAGAAPRAPRYPKSPFWGRCCPAEGSGGSRDGAARPRPARCARPHLHHVLLAVVAEVGRAHHVHPAPVLSHQLRHRARQAGPLSPPPQLHLQEEGQRVRVGCKDGASAGVRHRQPGRPVLRAEPRFPEGEPQPSERPRHLEALSAPTPVKGLLMGLPRPCLCSRAPQRPPSPGLAPATVRQTQVTRSQPLLARELPRPPARNDLRDTHTGSGRLQKAPWAPALKPSLSQRIPCQPAEGRGTLESGRPPSGGLPALRAHVSPGAHLGLVPLPRELHMPPAFTPPRDNCLVRSPPQAPWPELPLG